MPTAARGSAPMEKGASDRSFGERMAMGISQLGAGFMLASLDCGEIESAGDAENRRRGCKEAEAGAPEGELGVMGGPN